MHVDLSFSYLRSAATASFDKKSSTGTAQVCSTEIVFDEYLYFDLDDALSVVLKNLGRACRTVQLIKVIPIH